MVEYGNGISQGGAGAVGGGGGHANPPVDATAAFGQWVSDAAHTISTMPPAQLALLVVAVIVGFWVLRRAF
jgi:hypothetical protein